MYPIKKGIKRKDQDHFLLKAKDSPIANAANEVACLNENEYPFFLKDFKLEPNNHNKLNSDQRKV